MPGLLGRRGALLAGATLLWNGANAQSPARADDVSFRHRWTALDSIYQRVRKSRMNRSLTFEQYKAFVKLLREEELALFIEVRSHSFRDITEDNYWHRSRLKFPSTLQTELRLAEDGLDPATTR